MSESPLPTPHVLASVPNGQTDQQRTDGLLHDRFGRIARDLRISLTDRCNLRCSYCMPAEGLDWLPSSETLTNDEIMRLCQLAVRELGIHELRFTGGEPLLRKGLEEIIAACAALTTDEGKNPDIALTTNGLGLAHRAKGLAEAGLQRINISLDTLDRDHYASITRRDRLDDVLAGLSAAKEVGLNPIKVNAVIMRGLNDTDAAELLTFCLAERIQLRFIEQMPIGPASAWNADKLFTRDDILGLLGTHHSLIPVSDDDPHAPARLWQVDGNPTHTVGIIASVSAPFCGDCDRTRLTSNGHILSCLFATTETDLRTPLRNGASDADLAEMWRSAMWAKPAAHGYSEPSDAENENKSGTGFATPTATLSRIGG